MGLVREDGTPKQAFADFSRYTPDLGICQWFHFEDHQMKQLDSFDVTLTFCFTPEHCGLAPNHTSPPKDVAEFANFCARMTKRYAN
jgi:beta-xylosidase